MKETLSLPAKSTKNIFDDATGFVVLPPEN